MGSADGRLPRAWGRGGKGTCQPANTKEIASETTGGSCAGAATALSSPETTPAPPRAVLRHRTAHHGGLLPQACRPPGRLETGRPAMAPGASSLAGARDELQHPP